MSATIPHKCVLKEELEPLGTQTQRVKYESSEGTAKQGGMSKMFIPNTRNAYMKCKNSWLQFTVNAEITGTNLPVANNATPPVVTNADQIALSPAGACCFISSITLLQNQFPIAKLDNYDKIHSMLQVSQGDATNLGVRGLITGSGSYKSYYNNSMCGNTINSAYGLPSNIDGTQTNTKYTTPNMTFCLPIVGILGAANIPLCMLKEGLEIRVTWTDDVRKCFYADSTSTTASTITDKGKLNFSNINWDAEISTLEDSSQLEVERVNKWRENDKNGIVQWSDTFYYAYTQQLTPDTLNTATEMNTICAGFRYKSLKEIYHSAFCLPKALAYEPPCVPHNVFKSYQYRVAGVLHPKQPINTLANVVQSTLACNTNISQSATNGLMARRFTTLEWRPTETVPTTRRLFTDRGVLGVNFESFPDVNNISGLDSSDADTEFTGFTSTQSATGTVGVEAVWLAAFDCIYVIRDGILRRTN